MNIFPLFEIALFLATVTLNTTVVSYSLDARSMCVGSFTSSRTILHYRILIISLSYYTYNLLENIFLCSTNSILEWRRLSCWPSSAVLWPQQLLMLGQLNIRRLTVPGERGSSERYFLLYVYILFSHFSQIFLLSFPSHSHRFTNFLCLKSNFLFYREYGRRTCRRSLHITSEL